MVSPLHTATSTNPNTAAEEKDATAARMDFRISMKAEHHKRPSAIY